jgi:hypothetical protein
MYSCSGLGQTYANGQVQMPYSDVLIQGWSDASGNPSSTWQGFYLATYDYGSLPPILAGSPILSTTNNPGGPASNSVVFVLTDAQVQAILHGNQAATPAPNYIPNVATPASASSSPAAQAAQAAIAAANNASGSSSSTSYGSSPMSQLFPAVMASSGGSSPGLFGLSNTELLIGAGALVLLLLVMR